MSAPVLSFDGRRFTHGKEIVVSRLGGARLSGPLQKYSPGVPVAKAAVLLLPEGSAPPAAAETVAAAIILSAESEAARTRRLAGPARPLVINHIVHVPQRAAIALDKATYTAVAGLSDGRMLTLEAEAKPAVVAHTWNAIGRLTGRTPADAREVILLTAHLDHLGSRAPADGAPAADTIYNGADDDASGSIAVLELAEALATGKRPRRTIIFAWFGSEESGGAGASHFLVALLVPLERIVANLEFEMIGRADKAVPAHTLWLTGYERSTLGPASRTEARRSSPIRIRTELLLPLGQHSTRAARCHRANGLELRPAPRLSPAVRRREDDRLRAHDRLDPLDAVPGSVAGEFEVQTPMAAGEEAIIQ